MDSTEAFEAWVKVNGIDFVDAFDAWQYQQSIIDALTTERDALRAALNQPAKACEYCDDTGDVHSIDGEWRGECTVCDANKTKAAQQVESDSKND